MQVKTYIDRSTMSMAAARHAAQALRIAIGARGDARIVAATAPRSSIFSRRSPRRPTSTDARRDVPSR